MTSNYTHWLTKKEAAMYLKLSVRSIENLIKNGLLQSHKLGGRVLLDIKEIDVCVRSRCASISPYNPNDRL
jgi:excisionase family DNA binding protein